MKTLREVGVRPFLQGILLWILVAVGSLTLIRVAGFTCRTSVILQGCAWAELQFTPKKGLELIFD